MTFFSATWPSPSRNNIAILVAISIAYAAVSALAQIEFPAWGNSMFSPIELALWLAIFASLISTIFKLSSSESGGRLRHYWTLATVAIGSISVLQAADWFADTEHSWNSDGFTELEYFLNASLAIIIAAALFWSTRLPKKHIWVTRCLQITVIFQLLAIFSDATETGYFFGPLHAAQQFSFSTELAELLCIELYIVGLALTRSHKADEATAAASPFFRSNTASGGSFVGSNARQVYDDCNLYHGAKHPPVTIVFYPVFREITLFLVIFWLALTTGRIIKRATGKPITSQIREMTALWFSDGIDPPSYYAQELYEKTRSQDAPHYLTRYETKNGLLHALNNRSKNPFPVSEINNKVLFAECCEKYGIPFPQTLLTVSDGKIEWHCKPIDLETDLFCKRQRSMGAKGTLAFLYKAPGLYVDEAGQDLDLEGMLQALKHGSTKYSMLVQPWLRNHPSIADLAIDSLITMRVVTCMNEYREPEVTLAMLRLLTKLEPQWQDTPDEEYAAPINTSTGELGQFTGDNLRTSHLRYENHLVTGAPIHGRILAEWPAIRDIALVAHVAFPHRLLIGWDIALTDKGPMVLEGNTNLDVMFLQRVHNAPIGQSRLGELMNFHMKALYQERMAPWQA